MAVHLLTDTAGARLLVHSPQFLALDALERHGQVAAAMQREADSFARLVTSIEAEQDRSARLTAIPKGVPRG